MNIAIINGYNYLMKNNLSIKLTQNADRISKFLYVRCRCNETKAYANKKY